MFQSTPTIILLLSVFIKNALSSSPTLQPSSSLATSTASESRKLFGRHLLRQNRQHRRHVYSGIDDHRRPSVLSNCGSRSHHSLSFGKTLETASVRSNGSYASTRTTPIRTTPIRSTSAAVVFPPVIQNLARGSILKCLADLTGGLPLEVWKSNVVLAHIHARETNTKPPSSFAVLKSLLQNNSNANIGNKKGSINNTGGNKATNAKDDIQYSFQKLWSGLTPRMIEGLFSGSVLLAAKEGIHTFLSNYASPMLMKQAGVTVPASVIGFLSGAGGGMAQALVMGPTSLVVTACVAADKDETNREGVNAFQVVERILHERGIRGLYRGAPAVAMRQATNWASRQGFTEFVRPRIPVQGVAGELLAGCIGGTLSAWNTPFEVARIESQSQLSKPYEGEAKKQSFVGTMHSIVEDRGIGALYVGIVPRTFQACYQTIFLVCVPRLLG